MPGELKSPHLEPWSGGDFNFTGIAACKVEVPPASSTSPGGITLSWPSCTEWHCRIIHVDVKRQRYGGIHLHLSWYFFQFFCSEIKFKRYFCNLFACDEKSAVWVTCTRMQPRVSRFISCLHIRAVDSGLCTIWILCSSQNKWQNTGNNKDILLHVYLNIISRHFDFLE